MMIALKAATPQLPKTNAVADQVIALDEVGSTNALAAQMVGSGAMPLHKRDDGAMAVAVVAADRQTAGRGRNGHRWVSQPGRCSTISYAVRVPRAIATDSSINGWLQMIAGLVTLDALNGMMQEYGAVPNQPDCFLELKWPNDVFCHGLKMGGLLSELVLLPAESESAEGAAAADAGDANNAANTGDDVVIVFGVGLNLALGACRLPTPNSTSLQLHAAGLPSFDEMRDDVACRQVEGFRERLAKFFADPHGQAEALREEMKSVCWARGRQVEAHFTDGSTLTGEAIGLTEDASLILRTDDGVEHTVRTADVGVL
ncbi:biotin--[acetyl-CoA-carboxylase] ligase [Bifidobacterium olomucense]|uniref:biotin--[biotin carboxyl-carrier protein] ligase n=1 Tax=Bifidobacterium olomucense TaxID=2675324 RepID=A0A7Y0HXS6_9BIFI|nr:biotin--acetyl-CoA-carboxylase ligase [Bifidobacterium sp. DSM 109959]NMM98988.1 biotin--[acetyl-CoA-carboxylase] ligase [Bifidobacterium sp. DSM 109959]